MIKESKRSLGRQEYDFGRSRVQLEYPWKFIFKVMENMNFYDKKYHILNRIKIVFPKKDGDKCWNNNTNENNVSKIP